MMMSIVSNTMISSKWSEKQRVGTLRKRLVDELHSIRMLMRAKDTGKVLDSKSLQQLGAAIASAGLYREKAL